MNGASGADALFVPSLGCGPAPLVASFCSSTANRGFWEVMYQRGCRPLRCTAVPTVVRTSACLFRRRRQVHGSGLPHVTPQMGRPRSICFAGRSLWGGEVFGSPWPFEIMRRRSPRRGSRGPTATRSTERPRSTSCARCCAAAAIDSGPTRRRPVGRRGWFLDAEGATMFRPIWGRAARRSSSPTSLPSMTPAALIALGEARGSHAAQAGTDGSQPSPQTAAALHWLLV